MTGANDNSPKMQALAACPICRKMATETYRPFCSKRCADVDLGRWLGGTYAIPVTEIDESDEEDARPNVPGRRSEED